VSCRLSSSRTWTNLQKRCEKLKFSGRKSSKNPRDRFFYFLDLLLN
jgi:hypothetical protein